MTRFGILLLAANSLFAADFLTGQAARAVIGQPEFTAQLPGPANAIYPGNMLLGAAGGVAYGNGKLVIVDSSVFRTGVNPQNNRVLLYNNLFGPGDPTSTTGPTQLPPATAEPAPANSTYWWCPVCGGAADLVLGQTNFTAAGYAVPATASSVRTPTNAATDGNRLVVADTDNNRVLIWNTWPRANGQAADLVLGQPDFVTVSANTGTGNAVTPSAKTLRGPQGVWIQGNMLLVADSMNNRVLIWKSWPTTNGQAADVELGQPDFATQTQGDLTKGTPPASASNMLDPAAVSSDGQRLFVSDLGQSRVLVWNAIPTGNNAPADVALGQKDMVTSIPDNAFSTDATTGVETPAMCQVSNGKDSNGNPTYPYLCEATLNLPRFALSDGKRLFVADGGNDRVLVYEPVSQLTTGMAASVVLGQRDFISDTVTDESGSVDAARIAAADAIRTPSALAFDGTNLFVAEAFSRRVLVFTAASSSVLTAPRNAASMEVFALGLLAIAGTPTAGDALTITITDANGNATNYTYTVVTGDTLGTVATGIAKSMQADTNVLATAIPVDDEVRVMARVPGPNGDSIVVSAAASANAGTTIAVTAIGGGSDASHIAPGTLVAIFGAGFTDGATFSAPMNGKPLPVKLGTAPAAVEAFANGIPMPLLYAGPTQVNAQIPFEVARATSISLYVRTTHTDGTVTVANAAALPVNEAVPGVFAFSSDPTGAITGTAQSIITDPRPAVAVHYSTNATLVIDLELGATTPNAGDVLSVVIGPNTYNYTVLSTDLTLDNVRDNTIALINATDKNVVASAGAQWDRILLVATAPGTAGEGMSVTVSVPTGTSITASTYGSALCCSNSLGRGSLVTAANPAEPGEIITVYATGMGLVDPAPPNGFVTGAPYNGAYPNKVADYLNNFVSGLVGGSTAEILNASMMPGSVGLFEVDLVLSDGLLSDPFAEGTIAQGIYVTNPFTVAVQTEQ